MSLTEEQEQQLCDRYEEAKEEGSPLARLRAYTLSRGVAGIHTISRSVLVTAAHQTIVFSAKAIVKTNMCREA